MDRKDCVEKERDDEKRGADDKAKRAKEECKASECFHCICSGDRKDDADEAHTYSDCHKVGDLDDRSGAFDDVKPRHKQHERTNRDGGEPENREQKANEQDDTSCRHIGIWLFKLFIIFSAHKFIIQLKLGRVNKEKNFVICIDLSRRNSIYNQYVIAAERHIRQGVVRLCFKD